MKPLRWVLLSVLWAAVIYFALRFFDRHNPIVYSLLVALIVGSGIQSGISAVFQRIREKRRTQ